MNIKYHCFKNQLISDYINLAHMNTVILIYVLLSFSK